MKNMSYIHAILLMVTMALVGFVSPAGANERTALLDSERAILSPAKIPNPQQSGLFTPQSPPIYGSTFFSPNNAYNSNQNYSLSLPAGAFNVPTSVLKSWFVYVEGTASGNISQTLPGTETIASGELGTTGKGCSNNLCSAAGDKSLKLQTSGNSVSLSLVANIQSATRNPFWQNYTVTGASYTSGTGYTQGIYQWTAAVNTGSCSVLPSGRFQVYGTTIFSVQVTTPGVCGSGTTFTMPTLSGPSYGNPTSPGVITLTLGQLGGLGISVNPGQQFCGIIGQWGSDAPSALIGQQFAAFVDNNGNPLAGSPAVSVISNQISGATGFYYLSASNLRAQNGGSTAIGDIFNLIGSVFPSTTASELGWGGQLGPIGMIWGAFPATGAAPSTTALQTVCTRNQDPLVNFQSLFGKSAIHSFYRLNDIGTWSDSTGNFGNASPVSTPPTAGSASAQGSGLTLTDTGPYTTYPVSNYTSGTGPVKVSGSYNVSTLGGTPANIQAQISASPPSASGPSAPIPGCATCAWSILATPASGAYSGSISNVPAGGPYYISVRATNAPSAVVTSGPVYVGLVLIWHGQSQMGNMWANSQTAYTLSLSSPLGSLIAPSEIYSPGPASSLPELTVAGQPVGAIATLPIGPGLFYGSQNSAMENRAGDGITQYVLSLSNISKSITGTAWPIQVINLSIGGKPVEMWLNGYLQQTASVPVSSGLTYSATVLYVTNALGVITQGSTPNYNLYPSLKNNGAVQLVKGQSNWTASTMLAGSLILKDGLGNVLGSDTSTPTLGTSGGTCTGPTSLSCTANFTCTGPTIASCTINYFTGLITVTFTTGNAPSGGLNAFWTNIMDLQPGNSNAVQTLQYDGLDFVGNGNPATGLFSTVMSRAPFGINAVLFSQCTANDSEFGTGYLSGTAGATSLTAKYDYLFGTKYPSIFTGYSSTTPVIVLGHFRDVENLSSQSGGNIMGCNQWTKDYGNGVNIVGSFPHYYGGSYLDDGTEGDAPHEVPGIFGGLRIARRAAANTAAVFWPTAISSAEPTLTSASLGYSDSGNSYAGAFYDAQNCTGSTSSQTSNCIDITATLHNPNATALVTCGPNQNGSAPNYTSLATVFPNGSCTDGGIGQHVEGFRIGTANLPSYVADGTGNVYEDGMDPVGISVIPANAFTCYQVAPLVVQCKKTTGTWSLSAPPYITYGEPFAAGRTASLIGTPGATVGLTITAPGTCTGGVGPNYTNVYAASTVNINGTTNGTAIITVSGAPTGSITKDMTLALGIGGTGQFTTGIVQTYGTSGTTGNGGAGTYSLTIAQSVTGSFTGAVGYSASSQTPQYQVTYGSAGVTKIYPSNVGSGVFSAPAGMSNPSACSSVAVTLPAMCDPNPPTTQGTPTIPCIANTVSDMGMVGQYLYDNSALSTATGVSGIATVGSNVVTITGVTSGELVPGMQISGLSGVIETGSGGAGTYTMSVNQSVGAFSAATASSLLGTVFNGYEPGLPVSPVLGGTTSSALKVTH